MSTPVTLPALGESVTEGTITRWLKSVGDSVEVDEPLLEVSTDKVDTEIPSPVAGTLLEIKADEDETVEVGAELAIIGDEGEGGDDSGSADADDSDEGEADEAAEEDSGDEDSADEGEADEAAEEDSADEEETADEEEDTAEDDTGEEESDESEQKSSSGSSSGGSKGGGGTPVKLPELGESVTEGTVTKWLKSVGDSVEVDEPLLEVSTDKVDTEIPSPVAGTLLEIKVDEDETVEVGAELAIVGDSDAAAGGDDGGDSGDGAEAQAEEESEPEPEDKSEPEPEPEDKSEPEPEPEEQRSATSDSRGYVTPLVRKLAAEKGVDLESIEGTGVGGRIRKQDVLDAAKAKEQPREQPEQPAASGAAPAEPSTDASPLRGKTEKMSRLRKTIAKRMVESLQVSAQLTTVVEVDVTAVSRLRESAKADFAAREGVKLSFMPFFAKATIDTLKAHPSLNAGIDTDKGEITYFDHENLAVAVDTERGLLTPVIKNAGDLNVSGLARHIADLAERTRAGKIGPDELSGGTFTLTNTGSRGALFDTPIINQPQVAILGTGSVVKRPVVLDDPNLGETIAVRQMCYFSLTYDHRLVDGADAARFLSDLKQRVESGRFEV
jgi:2-oxoglutarate dehydrogenase E2 component (dihydrolipoamide succinyltransferase)